ncbi:MAG: hypothetical protein ACK5TN_06880, partial [Acidobacteriota bacterium]
MRKIAVLLAAAGCVGAARGDISFATTVKRGGAVGATTRFKMKGMKVRMESAGSITILDLEARTMTVLRPATKTYVVRVMEEGAVGMKTGTGQLKPSVKETGAVKKIGNYQCRQVMMTMEMAGGRSSLTMENEMWVSREVPGVEEWGVATKRMADKAIGPVMADGPTRKMLADMQREMAQGNGAPVFPIPRMQRARGMNEQMKAMQKQLEEMKKMG